MPALAKFMAMPPPMVPAPITAADLMAFTGVSLGTSGILATSRSEKKTWIWALDWVDCMHWPNSSRSRRSPSSKGRVAAASTASTQRKGAKKPRALRSSPLRNSAKTAGLVPRTLSCMSRIFRRGLPSATSVGEGAGALEEVAGDDLVHDAERLGLRGGNGIAADDDRQRRLHADEPRQPLGAARAGENAPASPRGSPPGRRRRRSGSGNRRRSRARRPAQSHGWRPRPASGSTRTGR